MAVFQFDASKAQEFGLIEPGWYEVMIEEAEMKYSSKGTPYLNMRMVIRDDVEQRFQGRKVFHSLFFTEKTENIVHAFFKAIRTPNGKTFESYDEMVDYVKGKTLKANIGIEKWEDKEYNRVSSVKESDYPLVAKQAKQDDPFTGVAEPIEIRDEDLPF